MAGVGAGGRRKIRGQLLVDKGIDLELAAALGTDARQVPGIAGLAIGLEVVLALALRTTDSAHQNRFVVPSNYSALERVLMRVFVFG